jgi:hypothetical protein
MFVDPRWPATTPSVRQHQTEWGGGNHGSTILLVVPPLAGSRGVDTADQTCYTTSWAPPFNQRTLSCLGYRRDRDMAFTNNRTINNTIILRDAPFWARGAAVPAPAKTAHVKNRESLLASAIS